MHPTPALEYGRIAALEYGRIAALKNGRIAILSLNKTKNQTLKTVGEKATAAQRALVLCGPSGVGQWTVNIYYTLHYPNSKPRPNKSRFFRKIKHRKHLRLPSATTDNV